MIRINRKSNMAKAKKDNFGKIGFELKSGSIPRFNIRTSMVLTTSQSLGTGFRIGCYGSVHVLLTDDLKEFFINTQGEAIYNKLRNLWKSTKNDGAACFIRDTALLKACKKHGVEINGKIPKSVNDLHDIQARIAGQKGMLEILPGEIMDSIGYSNYDVMVEENSWKYQHCKLYDDVLELNLLNAASDKFTSRLNYQYVNALDGVTTVKDGNSFIDTVETNNEYMNIVNDFYSGIEDMLEGKNEAELFKLLRIMGGFDINKKKQEISLNGIEYTAEDKNDIELVNKLASIVSVIGVDALKDDWCKNQFFKIIKGKNDGFTGGNIPIKGASRYVLSDTIAALRTDLKAECAIVDNKKVLIVDEKIVAVHDGYGYAANDNTLSTKGQYYIKPGDIVITSMDQVALRNNTLAYWGNANKCGDFLIMRTPCTHPGEPQVMNIINESKLNELPEFIEMKNGYKIPVREIYKNKKNIIVLSIFNVILDALGGADTDGDRVNIFQDERIVKMRAAKRKICVVEAGNNNNKDNDLPLNWDAFKINMRRSLRDSGTGRLTNLDTYWRDAQHAMQWIKSANLRGVPFDMLIKGTPSILFASINDSIKKAKEMTMDSELMNKIKNANKSNYELIKYAASLNIASVVTRSEIDIYINLIDSYMEMLKEFQEAAIAAPKTGDYLDFSLVEYMNTSYRPQWHKPNIDEDKMFTGIWRFFDKKSKTEVNHFMTPMATIYNTSKKRWDILLEKFGQEKEEEYDEIDMFMDFGFEYDEYSYKKEKRNRFEIPLDNLNKSGYEDASSEIIKVNRKYSALLGSIEKHREDKETYNKKFEEIKYIIRSEIIKIIEECGFDETMAAAYHPYTRGGEYFTAKSFVFVLIFDEFLMYLSNNMRGRKLIRIKEAKNKKLNYEKVVIDETEYAMIQLDKVNKKEQIMMLTQNATFKMCISKKEYQLTHDKIRKILIRNNHTVTINKDDKGLTISTQFLDSDSKKVILDNMTIGFLVKEDSDSLKSFMIGSNVVLEEIKDKATDKIMQFKIKYIA